jgi:hypothetical protein
MDAKSEISANEKNGYERAAVISLPTAAFRTSIAAPCAFVFLRRSF